MITLYIKTLTGQTVPIKTDTGRHPLIYNLKKLYYDSENVPIDQQNLIYKHQLLDDSQPLSHYGIQDNDALHLTLKLGGGPELAPYIKNLVFQTPCKDNALVIYRTDPQYIKPRNVYYTKKVLPRHTTKIFFTVENSRYIVLNEDWTNKIKIISRNNRFEQFVSCIFLHRILNSISYEAELPNLEPDTYSLVFLRDATFYLVDAPATNCSFRTDLEFSFTIVDQPDIKACRLCECDLYGELMVCPDCNNGVHSCCFSKYNETSSLCPNCEYDLAKV